MDNRYSPSYQVMSLADIYSKVPPQSWASRFRGIEALERLELGLVRDMSSGDGATLSVLDVGCGTGRAARLFPSDSYVGMDPVASFVRFAAFHTPSPRHSFIVAGMEHPPFSPATFHLVLLLGTLEAERDPVKRVRELAHLLRPGGRIVFTVQNRRNLPARLGNSFAWRYRQTFWSGQGLKDLLLRDWEVVQMASCFLLPPGAIRSLLAPLRVAPPLRRKLLGLALSIERLNAERRLHLGYELIFSVQGYRRITPDTT